MSQDPDGSRPMDGTSEADYRMLVAHDGANASVRFEAGEHARGRSNGLIPTFGEARTTVVLRADGKVMRVDGVEDIHAAVAVAAQAGAIPAAAAASLQMAFANELQLTNAQAAWGNLISIWHGREFRCGESQSVRIATTAYFAAHMNVVEMDATLQYVEQVDCPSERDPDARCVHLRMNAEADQSSLRTAREMWAQTGGDTARSTEARVRRQVDLIVEPDGLIPHELALEEFSELVWVEQGRRSARDIRDMSSYRFVYGPPTTTIMLSSDGAGFQVVQDGRVVTGPDTPECRALAACCSAASSAPHPGAINLMCAMARTPAVRDSRPEDVPCSVELASVRQILEGDDVPLPEGCQP